MAHDETIHDEATFDEATQHEVTQHEATFDEATEQRMAAIAANWDERTPIHLNSRFYDVAHRAPESWFADYEWDDLGDLTDADVLHLQCHLGTETAAFARRGARSVVGLDLSEAAIREARRLAAASDVDVEYVRANVYDAREALDGRTFDVVYTGKGALCYLPDLDRWARTVAALLKPGGRVYVVEFHPVLRSLGLVPRGEDDRALVLRNDYLEGRGAIELDATYTYTDGPPLTAATTSYEWEHGLGEIVSALVGAGIGVRKMRESDRIPWPRWPHMVPAGDGFWRLPDDQPRLPLFFALLGAKAR
ncbi:class I SAM-dependent methyltransferase [Actinoplanes oblitus]|uniref:Class I SAM-dependent methyltransferase n=1 Tax=Actinoplanes oblitus TaxID=3040509 RepID=A0ABY8WNF1_9ACTN|nr:class I SAM-dependent methyltransferase [Actinoplanes oblitus]WIM98972.1 class I SAM-dependent methyltransferase [Actinoplanes oblitus]